jgi:hypothetical protein
VAEYVAFKAQEHRRTLLSPRQLRSIRNELETLKKRFPRGPVSQFTPAALTNYMERGGPSLKTYNNRRGLLSTFFKFALQKDWIVSNPVEKTPHHRIAHRRGSGDNLSGVCRPDTVLPRAGVVRESSPHQGKPGHRALLRRGDSH